MELLSLEFLVIITTGLIGSLGHCIGMCGGFIMTYTSTKIVQGASKVEQATAHALYNIGRVTTYVLLGALFGYFGSLWSATPLSRAIIFTVAGVVMILMGLSLSGKLKFLTKIEYPLAQTNWFKKAFHKQLHSQSPFSFYVLGFLNGLIPCGLVYIMLNMSITTGSALLGALVMLVFGLATIPTLFTLGFVVSFLSQTRFRQAMITLSAIIVIIYGFWTLNKAYMQYDYMANTSVEKLAEDQKQEMKCGAGKCGAGKCGMGKCGSAD